jgi:peptidoglycan/xylan/chitin deacetylase (PgdA/CDA1 family)
MITLRQVKLSLLRGLRGTGVFRVVGDSRWRSRQLLILCYHGISIEDEHEWAPGLFMTADAFAARLELLDRARCTVLPLGEALERLGDGTLPPRSVVITFDDGNFDFAHRAWPLLEARGMPATVYLTTFYSAVNLPVFPLMVSYLLWKARGRSATLQLGSGQLMKLETASHAQRYALQQQLLHSAQRDRLDVMAKDALACRLATALDIDYEAIKRKRIVHLMNDDEVRDVAARGADVQLHTHRHRSPPGEARYKAEVAANRDRIAPLVGRVPSHFCYPSGVYSPQFARWLREEGVVSATTCQPGMATRRDDLHALPRVLDHAGVTPLEFEAWLSGLGAFLPRRRVVAKGNDDDGRPTLEIASSTSAPRPAHASN